MTTDGKNVTRDLLIGSFENIYRDETGLDLPNIYQMRNIDKERVKEDVILYSTINWHGIKYVNPRLILLGLAQATHDANYMDKLREHMLFSKEFLSALGIGAIFTESLFASGEEIGLDSMLRISKDIVPSVFAFLGEKLLHLGGVVSTIFSGGSTIAFLLPVVLLLSLFDKRKENKEFTENLIELIEKWKKLPKEMREIIGIGIDDKLGLPPGTAKSALDGLSGEKLREELNQVAQQMSQDIDALRSEIKTVFEVLQSLQQSFASPLNPESLAEYYGVHPEKIFDIKYEVRSLGRERYVTTAKEISEDIMKYLNGEGGLKYNFMIISGDPGVGKSWLGYEVAKELMGKAQVFQVNSTNLDPGVFSLLTNLRNINANVPLIFLIDDKYLGPEQGKISLDRLTNLILSFKETHIKAFLLITMRRNRLQLIREGLRDLDLKDVIRDISPTQESLKELVKVRLKRLQDRLGESVQIEDKLIKIGKTPLLISLIMDSLETCKDVKCVEEKVNSFSEGMGDVKKTMANMLLSEFHYCSTYSEDCVSNEDEFDVLKFALLKVASEGIPGITLLKIYNEYAGLWKIDQQPLAIGSVTDLLRFRGSAKDKINWVVNHIGFFRVDESLFVEPFHEVMKDAIDMILQEVEKRNKELYDDLREEIEEIRRKSIENSIETIEETLKKRILTRNYDIVFSTLRYLFRVRRYMEDQNIEKVQQILKEKVDGRSLLQILLDVAKEPIDYITLGSFGDECPDNSPEIYAEAMLTREIRSRDAIKCALKLLKSESQGRFLGAITLRRLSFKDPNSLLEFLSDIERLISQDDASWWLLDALKNLQGDYHLSEETKKKLLDILSTSPADKDEANSSLDIKMKIVELLSLHDDSEIEGYFLRQFKEGNRVLAARYFRLTKKIKSDMDIIDGIVSMFQNPESRDEALGLLLKIVELDKDIVRANLERLVNVLNVRDEYVLSAGMSYPLMKLIRTLVKDEFPSTIFEQWLESKEEWKVLVGSKFLFDMAELRPHKDLLNLMLKFSERDFDNHYVKSNVFSSLVVLAASLSLSEKERKEIIDALKGKLKYTTYFLPRLAQRNPEFARELREDVRKMVGQESFRERILDFFAYLKDEQILNELKDPESQAYFLSRLLLTYPEVGMKYSDVAYDLLENEKSENYAMEYMIELAKINPTLAMKYYPRVLGRKDQEEFFKILGIGLTKREQESEILVKEIEKSTTALSYFLIGLARGDPDLAWKFREVAVKVINDEMGHGSSDVLRYFFFIGLALPEKIEEIRSWRHENIAKRLAYASFLEGAVFSDPHRVLLEEFNLEDEKEVKEILERVLAILASIYPGYKFESSVAYSSSTMKVTKKAYGFALLNSSSPTSNVTVVTDARGPHLIVIADANIDLGAAGTFRIPLGSKIYFIDGSIFSIPLNLVTDCLIVISENRLNFSVIIDGTPSKVKERILGPCSLTLEQKIEWGNRGEAKLTGITCTSFDHALEEDKFWTLKGACTCDGIEKCLNCISNREYARMPGI
ncbi:hypothetical protein HS5_05290 [Acidianus sp. HS-5]|nr:hypothetical protein HS5_05290 [Acidianus sp. HS-5]